MSGVYFLHNLHLNKAATLKESQDLTILDFLFDLILPSNQYGKNRENTENHCIAGVFG